MRVLLVPTNLKITPKQKIERKSEGEKEEKTKATLLVFITVTTEANSFFNNKEWMRKVVQNK